LQISRPRRSHHGDQDGLGSSAASCASFSTAKACATVFGQTCQLCGCADEEQDNIIPSMRRVWGYPVDTEHGKNVGNLCKVCLKVYRARFRGKYATAETLKVAFGSDGQLFKLFKYWFDMCVKVMQTAGSHDCRVTWGSEASAKELIVVRKRETRLEEPEDEVWELANYQAKFGDYRTNNCGHKWVDWGDCAGVLVPGARIFKVKRARVLEVNMVEKIDAGDFQLGQDCDTH
jgi:hypothetical protein